MFSMGTSNRIKSGVPWARLLMFKIELQPWEKPDKVNLKINEKIKQFCLFNEKIFQIYLKHFCWFDVCWLDMWLELCVYDMKYLKLFLFSSDHRLIRKIISYYRTAVTMKPNNGLWGFDLLLFIYLFSTVFLKTNSKTKILIRT